MAYGFKFSSGGNGNIVPHIKYDARSGRIFRADRTKEANGNYTSNAVDITSKFEAVFDMENVELGWMSFESGKPPEMLLVPADGVWPLRPKLGKWKEGARVMLRLSKACGGDVRELASNAAAFCRGFDELGDAYAAAAAAHPGKLPIVKMAEATPITTGSGAQRSTNYKPTFEITGWVDRPEDLIFIPKAGMDDEPGAPPDDEDQASLFR